MNRINNKASDSRSLKSTKKALCFSIRSLPFRWKGLPHLLKILDRLFEFVHQYAHVSVSSAMSPCCHAARAGQLAIELTKDVGLF